MTQVEVLMTNLVLVDKQASSPVQRESRSIRLPEDKPLGAVFFNGGNNYVFFGSFFAYGLFCLTFVFIFWPEYDSPPLLSRTSLILSLKVVLWTIWFPALFVALSFTGFLWDSHADIPLSVLSYLLKEVELQGTRNAEINWRKIAYFANQLSRELECYDPIFYGGDHCRKYFRDHVVPAVENESYQIETFIKKDRSYPVNNFKNQQSQRALLDRSVRAFWEVTNVSQRV